MMEHASTRILPPGLYGLDDLCVGDRIDTGKVAVTGKLIDSFVALSGDDFEIHTSEQAAARHGFPARIAHGLLVLALVDGLKYKADARIHAQASLGWQWTFRRPVLAGDTIQAHITVTDKRLLTDRERGILTLDLVVTNQDDAVVQSGTNTLMCYRST